MMTANDFGPAQSNLYEMGTTGVPYGVALI